ncbi:LysR family transcriptional regulator [Roseobacteraceae bacterium S113]
MDKWDEMRTAYMVAKLGTVSAASNVLGIHRATIIRHIDNLEAALGAKIFLRHARGYTMTETGTDLLRVASATEEQFADLANRARGQAQNLSGELIVTSVEIMAAFMLPALQVFRTNHPDTQVRYLISGKLMNLDYGEAHVAIRGGPKPDSPDSVVQPFFTIKIGLYASQSYVSVHGNPSSVDAFADHFFVADDRPQTQFNFQSWLQDNVPADRVVFRSSNQRIQQQAIANGIGIGFSPQHEAEKAGLIEVMPPLDDWDRPYWLVTHMDLHRTTKVQAFLTILKDQVSGK